MAIYNHQLYTKTEPFWKRLASGNKVVHFAILMYIIGEERDQKNFYLKKFTPHSRLTMQYFYLTYSQKMHHYYSPRSRWSENLALWFFSRRVENLIWLSFWGAPDFGELQFLVLKVHSSMNYLLDGLDLGRLRILLTNFDLVWITFIFRV